MIINHSKRCDEFKKWNTILMAGYVVHVLRKFDDFHSGRIILCVLNIVYTAGLRQSIDI